MIFFFSVLSLCCHFCVWPLIIWLSVAQPGATQHYWALLPLVLPSPLHYPELTIFVIKSLLGSLLSTTANYQGITGTKGLISRWKLCNGEFWFKKTNPLLLKFKTLYWWPPCLPWCHFTTVVPTVVPSCCCFVYSPINYNLAKFPWRTVESSLVVRKEFMAARSGSLSELWSHHWHSLALFRASQDWAAVWSSSWLWDISLLVTLLLRRHDTNNIHSSTNLPPGKPPQHHEWFPPTQRRC